jgi:hypothetical protein
MAERTVVAFSYTSLSVRHRSRAAVIKATRSLGRDAYVSFIRDNVTVVYDKESEERGLAGLASLDELASALTRRLKCSAVSSLVHQDKVLILSLFDRGELYGRYLYVKRTWRKPVDEISCVLSPEDFAREFCKRFGAEKPVEEIAGGLRNLQSMTGHRHGTAFAANAAASLLMGLGPCTVGYHRLAAGEVRFFPEPDDLTKV